MIFKENINVDGLWTGFINYARGTVDFSQSGGVEAQGSNFVQIMHFVLPSLE